MSNNMDRNQQQMQEQEQQLMNHHMNMDQSSMYYPMSNINAMPPQQIPNMINNNEQMMQGNMDDYQLMMNFQQMGLNTPPSNQYTSYNNNRYFNKFNNNNKRGGKFNYYNKNQNQNQQQQKTNRSLQQHNDQNQKNVISPGLELAISVNPLLKEINPETFDHDVKNAKFFVIKSYSEDNIHKSIKYGVWSSTKVGNDKLEEAQKNHNNIGKIYLFFSVNASGQFLGVCEMLTNIQHENQFGQWAQENKWQGQFYVKWIFTKDIPNKEFRHIILENNENKPVTNSRDCQEVLEKQGKAILKIFADQKHSTTIIDDYEQQDTRQSDMEQRRNAKLSEYNQQLQQQMIINQQQHMNLN